MEKNLTACYRAWSIPDVCTVPCVPASMWKMRGDFSVGGARVCFRIPENPCSPRPVVAERANPLPPVADSGMKEIRTKKKKHMTKDVNGMKKKCGRPALGRTRKLTKGVTVQGATETEVIMYFDLTQNDGFDPREASVKITGPKGGEDVLKIKQMPQSQISVEELSYYLETTGAVLEIPGAVSAGAANINWLSVVLGVAAAAVSGYFAVRFMIKLITKHSLWGFAIYTAILGVFIVLDQNILHLIAW